jgi:cytochrome P450
MVQSDPRTRSKGPEHLAAFEWMRDYAAKVIAMRRAAPRNDLISNFASAEIDGDRLDEREVLLTTTTLIMAGVESLDGFMMMFATLSRAFLRRARPRSKIRNCSQALSRRACASTPRPSASAAA